MLKAIIKSSIKRALVIPFFFFAALFSSAQERKSLKIYQNTDIFRVSYRNSWTGELRKSSIISFSRISLGLDLSSGEGYKHEIEVFIPEVKKPFDRAGFPMNYEFMEHPYYNGYVSSYSMRYVVRKAMGDRAKKLKVNLGLGLNPYYINSKYLSTITEDAFVKDSKFGAVLDGVPEIEYKIGERLSLIASVPVKIFDLQRQLTHWYHPDLSIRERKDTDVKGIFFESSFTIRLGLMYALSKK
jgi:hypothetical protein